MKTASVQLHIS